MPRLSSGIKPPAGSSVTLASLFSLVVVCAAQDASLHKVEKAFNDANIPANLNIAFQPSMLLDVTFPQEYGHPIALHAGIQVPVNDTVGPPTFSLQGQRRTARHDNGPFVVAMVDPDAPTPQDPSVSQIRHFLGGNFYLGRDGCSLFNTTPAITEYVQPAPPSYSDAHRYVLLVYKQPKTFAQQDLVNASSSILSFNISQFASAVELGSPLAGTFMLVSQNFTRVKN
ncbi:PEBP-like protein [Roridomyces roridus]|uniref:PEBP-like protein n=1 Tax=Roridomyces roridus TaxID=1738132 RepID=A0AAD7C1I3_9AGAR|nr:PEBP-like protein [Roridomyces roridus]